MDEIVFVPAQTNTLQPRGAVARCWFALAPLPAPRFSSLMSSNMGRKQIDGKGPMPEITALPIANFGNVSVTLPDLLHHLQRLGRLQNLLGEAPVEEFLIHQATQAGLAVSREDLQRAADFERGSQGFASAERMRTWLARPCPKKPQTCRIAIWLPPATNPCATYPPASGASP